MIVKVEDHPMLNGSCKYRVYFKKHNIMPWAWAYYKDFKTMSEAIRFAYKMIYM